MKSAPAIGFLYRPSRILRLATILVALLAILAVWLSAAPPSLQIVLSAVIAVIGGASQRRLLRPRVRSILWRADGGVDLTLDAPLADAPCEMHGTLAGGRILGPLIVLTLRWPPRASASLWLLPDNLDADTRRLLRMRLGAAARGSLASGNTDSG